MASDGVLPPDRTPPPPVAKPTRKDVDSSFKQFASLIEASNRPLPDRYGGASLIPLEKRTGIFTDIGVLRKGGFLLESISTLYAVYKQHKKGGPTDDRRMIVRCFNTYLLPHICRYCVRYARSFETQAPCCNESMINGLRYSNRWSE